MKLDIKRNRILIQGDVKSLDSLNIQGYRGDNISKKATCNLDINAVNEICRQKQCTATDKLKAWYITEREKIKKANNAQKTCKKYDNVDYNLIDVKAKNYQVQAVNFFLSTGNALISYGMGLGKTLISIMIIKHIKKNTKAKILVVCPAYLKYSYAHELKKWSNLSYTIIDGTPKKRDFLFKEHQEKEKDVLIINYEQIRVKKGTNKKKTEYNMHDYIKNTIFDLVIWDEAHRLKNKDSQITCGAYSIKADKKLMLTGTPITKNAGEIFSLLSILDNKRFRSYWTFVDYYCNILYTDYGQKAGSIKRITEYQNILKAYMIRKLMADVAKHLPEKVFTEIPVVMYEEQEKAYNRAMKEFLNPDDSIIGSDVERFIRLCQINQNPAILGGKDVSISRDATLDLISDIGEQRIIVACTYIGMSTNLKNSIEKSTKGRNVYLINSKVKDREKVINDFKRDNSGILVTTIKCLAEGVNLDCCDYIIFTDIDWNYGINEQFKGRIYRMTSTRTKFYYYIIVKNTVHEYKHKKIAGEQLEMTNTLGDSEQNIIRKFLNDFKKNV